MSQIRKVFMPKKSIKFLYIVIFGFNNIYIICGQKTKLCFNPFLSTFKQVKNRLPAVSKPKDLPTLKRLQIKPIKAQVYLCKILRISCLAIPFSSHVWANFTLSCLALLFIFCPFSPRHRSIVCRNSMPTASRVPFAAIPFLATGLRPPPVLTWKSSKATLRFSVRCAAAAGWSAEMGQQILRER